MLHENMDYVEALKHLAAKYNIEIEEDEVKERKRTDSTCGMTLWNIRVVDVVPL